MNLSKRETATILAALRHWELALTRPESISVEVGNIATDGGTLLAQDSVEIDELCERLNFAEDENPADRPLMSRRAMLNVIAWVDQRTRLSGDLLAAPPPLALMETLWLALVGYARRQDEAEGIEAQPAGADGGGA